MMCHQYRPLVITMLRRMGRMDLLEDVLQEIAVAELSSPPQSPGAAWVSAVVRNQVTRYSRRPTESLPPVLVARRPDDQQAVPCQHAHHLYVTYQAACEHGIAGAARLLGIGRAEVTRRCRLYVQIQQTQ